MKRGGAGVKKEHVLRFTPEEGCVDMLVDIVAEEVDWDQYVLVDVDIDSSLLSVIRGV